MAEIEAKLAEAVQKADAALASKSMLDAKLEWRTFERTCARREWCIAWDRLLVKIDAVDQQADIMDDLAVSNTMAVALSVV